MTKEEAIKWIDDRMCYGRGKWSEHHRPVIDEYWQAGEMAINALKAEPHWIPVTERLPKEDGDYLVTYEEGYAEDYGFSPIGIAPFEVDCEGFGVWQENFDRYTLGSLGSDWVEIKVIAWMPLPEPYREVTE